MGKLSGKNVIITGASAGFGQGTAQAFAAEGCNLVLTARREERLQDTAAKCEEIGRAYGIKPVYFAGDARDEETAIQTVKLAMDTFGQIDILVNNAGIGRVLSLVDTTMEDYDLVMDSNVRSAFAFTKYTVPEML